MFWPFTSVFVPLCPDSSLRRRLIRELLGSPEGVGQSGNIRAQKHSPKREQSAYQTPAGTKVLTNNSADHHTGDVITQKSGPTCEPMVKAGVLMQDPQRIAHEHKTTKRFSNILSERNALPMPHSRPWYVADSKSGLSDP